MPYTTLTFFHSPDTRSFGTRVQLDELGAPYRMRVLDRERWNARPSVARGKVELAALQAARWSPPRTSSSFICFISN